MTFFNKANVGMVAWNEGSADSFLLARGSTQPDTESSGIEVLRFDPLNPSVPVEVLGKCESAIALNCINWTNSSAEFPQGLVTCGLKDGSLAIFDASKINGEGQRETTTAEDALVTSFELYPNGDLNCMEFNPFKPTLLATGGNDIYIVNFEKGFTEPEIIIPQASQSNAPATVTDVAWNKSKAVQHILASAQENGRINIVDLKLKKNIFSFSDGREAQSGRKVKVAWNPSVATQIAVAFDEAESGVQVWDLRNNKAPLKVISNNMIRNVHSITWSPTQKSTVLLANREGDFFEYNLETDSYEHFSRPGFNTLFARYASLKDTVYAVSVDGELLIYSKNATQLQQAALKQFPVHLKAKSQACLSRSGTGIVTLRGEMEGVVYFRAQTEGQLNHPNKAQIEQFERTLFEAAGSPEKLAQKLSRSGQDPLLVSLLSVVDRPIEEKLAALEIDVDAVLKRTEKVTGKSYLKQEKKETGKADLAKKLSDIKEDEAVNFFSDLGRQEEEPKQEPPTEDKPFEEAEQRDIEQVSIQRNRNWSRGIESLVRKNLILGNIEGAIDLCLKADRVYEAFLIASSNPSKKESMVRYLLESYSDSEGFVKNILTPATQRNFEQILNSFSADQWKDALSFIAKSVPVGVEQTACFNRLIDNLKQDQKYVKAQRYITVVSGRLDEFVNSLLPESMTDLQQLLSSFELLYLLKLKNNLSLESPFHEKQLLRLVLLLVETEHIQLAYDLLSKFGSSKSDHVKSLQTVIFNSFSSTLQTFYYAPKSAKKTDFVFPKKKQLVKAPKATETTQSKPNPFGQQSVQPKLPQSIDNPFGNSEQKKPVKPAPIPSKIPTPAQPTLKPAELEHTRNFGQPAKTVPTPPPPFIPPQSTQQHQIFEEAPKQQHFSKQPAPVPLPTTKPLGPPPIPQRTQQTTLPPKIETQSSHNEFKSFVPPPRPIQTLQPSQPQSKVVAPPPLSTRTPLPTAPLHKYDEAKVASINEFIGKAPEVLSLIDQNPTSVRQMQDSLKSLSAQIASKSIDGTTFDRFAQVVHLIEENRLSEAANALREASNGLKQELQSAWLTFDRIVKYLL